MQPIYDYRIYRTFPSRHHIISNTSLPQVFLNQFTAVCLLVNQSFLILQFNKKNNNLILPNILSAWN